MPSLMPPCICASSPRGLTARPTSTAKVTRVTRGPVTASRICRPAVAGRVSISTRQAETPLYSLWMAMPCAVPAGIALPHSPCLRDRVEDREEPRSLRWNFRRNW